MHHYESTQAFHRANTPCRICGKTARHNNHYGKGKKELHALVKNGAVLLTSAVFHSEAIERNKALEQEGCAARWVKL